MSSNINKVETKFSNILLSINTIIHYVQGVNRGKIYGQIKYKRNGGIKFARMILCLHNLLFPAHNTHEIMFMKLMQTFKS